MPAAEVVPYPTLAKAKQFFDTGGVVVAYGMLPKSATLATTRRTSHAASHLGRRHAPLRFARPAAGGRSYFLPAQPTPEEIHKVLRRRGIHPTLEVLARRHRPLAARAPPTEAGRDVFLVCNQNHEGAARVHVQDRRAGRTGMLGPDAQRDPRVPYRRIDAPVEVDVTLEPSESVMLVFQSAKARAAAAGNRVDQTRRRTDPRHP